MEAIEESSVFLNAVTAAAEEQSVPVCGAVAEYGIGQYEVNLRHVKDPVLAADPSDTDDAVLAGEARARARAALNLLSHRDRQLLILRHEGYSYRELARAVGVAEGSVGTMLIRATSAFRKSLPDAIDADTRAAQRRGRHASE